MRRTVTTVAGVGAGPAPSAPPGAVGAAPASDGVTPTVSQAVRDRVRVLAGGGHGGGREAREVGVGADRPPVSAAYQIGPAPSADLPPIAVAASTKARLGMPELRCTPPLSSVVST